jgi:hypothetical protein
MNIATSRFSLCGLALSALLPLCISPASTATAADSAPVDNTPVQSTWQHHQIKFEYYGITTLYSCDGLETHVKGLLLHFGARKDASVQANGCARGPDHPSHFAFLTADFYTLAPVSDSSTPDTVSAEWTPLEVTPRRPYFMGDGDCELVKDLKDVISKNFSLRDLNYQTDCVPHTLNINGFSIKAQALKVVPTVKAAAVKG